MTISGKAAIAALGFLICAGAAARAEGDNALPACPANAEAYANSIRGYFEQKEGPINEDAINDANLLEVVCADQFITMYQLADAWYQLLFRTDLTLEQQGTIANRALTILVNADKAPFTAHNYASAATLRERVVTSAINYAEAGGPRAPFFVENGEFGSCESHWGNISQTLWYAYRDTWTGDIRPILIANASRACADQAGLYAHEYYGALLAEQARRATDPQKAIALMQEALAAYLLYTGPDRVGVGWNMDKQTRLERELVAMHLAARTDANTLSDEEIFAPEHVGTERALYDLAWKLNQAYQPVERREDGTAVKGEITRQLSTYYERVKQLDAPAKAAGIEAQRFFFNVLKGHAEKDYRTSDTADLSAPPQIIWAARDPDGNTLLIAPKE